MVFQSTHSNCRFREKVVPWVSRALLSLVRRFRYSAGGAIR